MISIVYRLCRNRDFNQPMVLPPQVFQRLDEAMARTARSWRPALLSLGLLLAASCVHAADAEQPARFPSPDGRRVVYLSLLRNDLPPNAAGFGHGRPALTLRIEYAMVHGAKEAMIRPYVAASSEQAQARYRVMWDDEDQRFLVLCDQPIRPSGRIIPRWNTGEHVVFFHDRVTEQSSPSQPFVPADWNPARVRAGSEAVVLPVVAIEQSKLASRPEAASKTGELRRSGVRPDARGERVLNFTVHPNTQNLKKSETRPLFTMPATQMSLAAPDGSFEARWLGDAPTVFVLAEGGRFRDQLWVLRYELQLTWTDPVTRAPREHRFAWSQDSRHLLVLTRDSGQKGFSRLPSGEEVVLIFDVRQWDGVIAPSATEFNGIALAP